MNTVANSIVRKVGYAFLGLFGLGRLFYYGVTVFRFHMLVLSETNQEARESHATKGGSVCFVTEVSNPG